MVRQYMLLTQLPTEVFCKYFATKTFRSHITKIFIGTRKLIKYAFNCFGTRLNLNGARFPAGRAGSIANVLIENHEKYGLFYFENYASQKIHGL